MSAMRRCSGASRRTAATQMPRFSNRAVWIGGCRAWRREIRCGSNREPAARMGLRSTHTSRLVGRFHRDGRVPAGLLIAAAWFVVRSPDLPTSRRFAGSARWTGDGGVRPRRSSRVHDLQGQRIDAAVGGPPNRKRDPGHRRPALLRAQRLRHDPHWPAARQYPAGRCAGRQHDHAQLARQSFLPTDLPPQGAELILAGRIERLYAKDQILEMLTRSTSVTVSRRQAASAISAGTRPSCQSRSGAPAGLVKSPSSRPTSAWNARRGNVVLQAMADAGNIDPPRCRPRERPGRC